MAKMVCPQCKEVANPDEAKCWHGCPTELAEMVEPENETKSDSSVTWAGSGGSYHSGDCSDWNCKGCVAAGTVEAGVRFRTTPQPFDTPHIYWSNVPAPADSKPLYTFHTHMKNGQLMYCTEPDMCKPAAPERRYKVTSTNVYYTSGGVAAGAFNLDFRCTAHRSDTEVPWPTFKEQVGWECTSQGCGRFIGMDRQWHSRDTKMDDTRPPNTADSKPAWVRRLEEAGWTEVKNEGWAGSAYWTGLPPGGNNGGRAQLEDPLFSEENQEKLKLAGQICTASGDADDSWKAACRLIDLARGEE